VLNKPLVLPTNAVTNPCITLEIEGPQAFGVVSFAPGSPTTWDVPRSPRGRSSSRTSRRWSPPCSRRRARQPRVGRWPQRPTSTRSPRPISGSGRPTPTRSQYHHRQHEHGDLTWATVTNADGYVIHRGTSAGNENVLVATVSGGSTVTYTDAGGAYHRQPPRSSSATPWASVIGTTATSLNHHQLLKLTNVIVRNPMNPTIHGIDIGYLLNCDLKNVKVDTGGSTGDTLNPIVQPTGGTIGIIFPGEGNGGHVAAGTYRRGLRLSARPTPSTACSTTSPPSRMRRRPANLVRLPRLQPRPDLAVLEHRRDCRFWHTTASPGDPRHIAQSTTRKPTRRPTGSDHAHIDDPTNKLRGHVLPPGHLRYRDRGLACAATALPTPTSPTSAGSTAASSTRRLRGHRLGDDDQHVAGVDPSTGARHLGSDRLHDLPGLPRHRRAGNNYVGWDTGQGLVQLHSRITMSPTALRFNAGLLLNYVDVSNWLAVRSPRRR
jgi:hypothetical protein